MIALLLLACVESCGGKALDTASDDSADTSSGPFDTSDTSDTSVDTGEVWVQDEPHPAGVLSGGAIWRAGTHRLLGDLRVESGVLELEPCATVFVAPGARLVLTNGGAIRAVGTPQCPVTLLSEMGGRGDWAGLRLEGSSDGANNLLEQVAVLNGGMGGSAALDIEDGASVAMTNVRVAGSAGMALRVGDLATLRRAEGLGLVDNAGRAASLPLSAATLVASGTFTPNDVAGLELRGGSATGAHSLARLDAPWILAGDLRLGDDVTPTTLSIAAGAELRMARGVSVDVRGSATLELAGEEVRRVSVLSAEETGAPGDWGALRVHAEGALEVRWSTLRHGGAGEVPVVQVASGGRGTLDHAEVSESAGSCDVDGEVTVVGGGARACGE